MTELAIPIEDQVARSFIIWERLAQSLADPRCGGIGRDTDVQDSPTRMMDDEEDVEYLKGHCRHREEIHGGEAMTVVAQERHPSLMGIGIGWASWHVSSDGTFGHIKAEHLNLTMDTGRTPSWILHCHAPYKIPNLAIDRWSTTSLGT